MKYLTTEEGLSRRLAPGMTAQKPRPRCGAGVREVALSRRGRTRGGTVHSTALPLLQLPGAANPAARECRRWRSVLKAPATCSEPHVQRSVAQGPAHPSLALEAGPSPSTSSMPTAPGGAAPRAPEDSRCCNPVSLAGPHARSSAQLLLQPAEAAGSPHRPMKVPPEK